MNANEVASKDTFDQNKSLPCTIDVSHQDLEVWPDEDQIPHRVTTINACKNKLTTVISFARFSGLLDVDISRNLIVTLEGMDLLMLVNLRKLDISRNLLTSVDQLATDLRSLEVLLCQHNSISELPNGMGKLIRLKSLNISFNKLTTLGSQLEQNTFLENLNVTNNENMSFAELGERARRLIDRRILLSSKMQRRALIVIALKVSENVILREQSLILSKLSSHSAPHS